MRILLICFSGTGNTEKIAAMYRDAFEKLGCSVTLAHLPERDKPCVDPSEYDIVGIGYPIHAFNAPKTILDRCRAFPNIKKRKIKTRAFIFKTSGEPVRMSDVSSLKLRKILKKLGYEVNAEYQYVMPYNIIFRHSDKTAYKMLETAKALVPIDAEAVLSNEKHLPRKVPFGGLIAWVLRIEHPGAKLIGRFFRVERDKCIDCGLCVNSCPVENIRYKADGRIVFGGNCMMCMRCAFNCPKDAIDLGMFEGWKVNGKYSFEPPETEEEDKHANYCRKAYDRYYKTAAERISSHRRSDTEKF